MLPFSKFLLWFMMLALPLQGWAAASMQHCGKAKHAVLEAHTHAPGHHSNTVLSATHHHHHAMHGETMPVADAEQAPDAKKQLPSAAHQCSACASCCNLMAITATPSIGAIHPAPNAPSLEPVALIHSICLDLPEKPPRA